MTRYADPSVCPDCRSVLPADPATCPVCALPLRGPLAVSLFRTLATADDLLARLRAGAGVPVTPASPAAPARSVPAVAAVPVSDAGPRRTGLSGLSVATVLLGLGALCLLVAAVTFLAVAWSALGVGGRTAVLVALTVAAAAAGHRLARRGLGVAGEALVLVSLGLLALDAVGAVHAGWLGEPSWAGATCLVGALVLAGALALLLLPERLVVPQVVAALSLGVVLAGLGGLSTHDQVVLVAGVLAYAVLAALGHRRHAVPLTWLALAGTALTWAGEAQRALVDAAAHPSLYGLWAHGHAVGLVVAAGLLLAPVPVLVRSWPLPAQAAGAAAACLLSLAVAMPVVDEGATRIAVVALVLLLLWSGVALRSPAPWRPVALAPLALAAVPVTAVSGGLLATALSRALAVGEPFARPAGVLLPGGDAPAHPAVLVPGVLGLLLALLVVTRVPVRLVGPAAVAGAAVVALAGVATLALHPVPLGLVVVATCLVALALGVAALGRADLDGTVTAAGTTLVALSAVGLALPSAALTVLATGVLTLGAAAVALLGRFPHARTGAGALLPLAAAALLWSLGEATRVDVAFRAAPVLVVAGLLAIARPRPEVELAAVATAVTVPAAVLAAADPATALAVHLTLAGVLVSTTALVHPARRTAGWLGGVLLAAATWVRLADTGVVTPEAYTLPSALALVAFGLLRLRRDPGAGTLTALAPGLVLATTPSLLQVLGGDVLSWRALLLGIGCLALVLVGARLHWNAPLVVGAAAGVLLVLTELAPYAARTPQWIGIGAAGLLLTVVGVTWERRMLEVQRAAGYLGRLR